MTSPEGGAFFRVRVNGGALKAGRPCFEVTGPDGRRLWLREVALPAGARGRLVASGGRAWLECSAIEVAPSEISTIPEAWANLNVFRLRE